MTNVPHQRQEAPAAQPGETLRNARERRNLSLPEVAAALNLSPEALANLEDGQFERLPGHTFARGYIRAYAKLLGLDQDLLVRVFDAYTGTNAKGSNVRSISNVEGPVRDSQKLLRIVSLVLLVLIAVGGFFWWQDQQDSRQRGQAELVIEHVEVEAADGTTQIHALEPDDQPEKPAEIVVVAPARDISSTGVTTPSTAESSSTAAGDGVATAPASEAVSASLAVVPGQGLLNIHFTADCWVKASDANGKVLFSGLKRAGETIELSAKVPLDLRLGYAPAAQVTFNGKAINLAPFTVGQAASLKLGQ